jgi:hypothetical protein
MPLKLRLLLFFCACQKQSWQRPLPRRLKDVAALPALIDELLPRG